MPDHAHARAGRSNDGSITLAEGMQEIHRDRTRLLFKPIIEKRLSTAGLFGGKEQFHAKALEDACHVLKRRGIELIAEAGNEKLGFSHVQLAQERLVQTTVHADDLPGGLAEFAAAEEIGNLRLICQRDR